MEITYIKEFIVLAEICNYGRAAEALYISQTSLFNHIRALETDIGTPLFDKKGRKIVLSESGQLFLPYAKTIAAASEEFAAVLKESTKKKNALLRIAIQYTVTELIQAFRTQYPDYGIHFLDSQIPIEMLANGSCELAFVRDVTPEMYPECNIIPYFTDTVTAAVYASHPLARRKSVLLTELKSEDFVMIAQRKKRDCYCMKVCKNAGFVPKVAMTAATGTEAVKMVDAGMGISLFLRGTLSHEKIDNLVLLELEPDIKCTVSLCWRKDRMLSPAAEAFIQFVKQRSKKAERH